MAVIDDLQQARIVAEFSTEIDAALVVAYDTIEHSKGETNPIRRIRDVECLLQTLSELHMRVKTKIQSIIQEGGFCIEHVSALMNKNSELMKLIEEAKKLKMLAYVTESDYTIHMTHRISGDTTTGFFADVENTIDAETVCSRIVLSDIQRIQQLKSTALIWMQYNVHLVTKELASIIQTQYKGSLNPICALHIH